MIKHKCLNLIFLIVGFKKTYGIYKKRIFIIIYGYIIYSQISFITKYNSQLKLIDLRIYKNKYITFYKIIYMFEVLNTWKCKL